MENIDLKKISKKDLIKVIATMHDTIQDWNNGYGIEKEDAETLIKIGSACTSFCVNKRDWILPILK